MQLALSVALLVFWTVFLMWIWCVRRDLRMRPNSFSKRTRALTWLVVAAYMAAVVAFIGREVSL